MLGLVACGALLYLAALAAARPPAVGNNEAAARRERDIAAVNALLPQTQCRDCGYPGCLPYARAVIEQDAPLNLCPPGGAVTVRRLERLLGRTSQRLPAPPAQPATVARVDEQACIGCVKCITACPVDAIVGAAGQLHAVIPAYCTGCGLCVPPCPMDCIAMVPAAAASPPPRPA